MKVRIVSGNQAGAVVDLPRPAAESAVATGYAELYAEPESAPAKDKPKKNFSKRWTEDHADGAEGDD